MADREYISERLKAYIHPNVAATEAQKDAFAEAVDAQLAYENAQGTAEVPGNVRSYSVGNYSVTRAESAGGIDTQATVCPAAWAILFNAGLLQRGMPTEKRL